MYLRHVVAVKEIAGDLDCQEELESIEEEAVSIFEVILLVLNDVGVIEINIRHTHTPPT